MHTPALDSSVYAWEDYIRAGLSALPERFREKIHNVTILLEDKPSRRVRRVERLARDETLLGYYQGVPLPERGTDYGIGVTLPDTITLYREPILIEAGGDPRVVEQMVIDTLWHEFGHYFGLDEHEIARREVTRRSR